MPLSFESKIKTKTPTTTGALSFEDKIKAVKAPVEDIQEYKVIEPSFKASEGTGPGAVVENTFKTIGNIPSSGFSLVQNAVAIPTENIEKSVGLAKDIYKDRGFSQGTKDILSGAFDVWKSIGQAVVNKGNQNKLVKELSPIQDNLVKTRDELVQKIHEGRAQGKDVTKLTEGLKFAVQGLEEIDKQIGTKEARNNQALDTAIDIFKYPIERPADVILALYGGKSATGKDIVSTMASPVTRGADTSISGIISRVVEPLPEKYIAQTADEWAKVGTDYVSSRKVLAKGEARGKDAPQFLADRGINPDTTKAPGERMAIADRIAKEDTKPFETVLDASLKEADMAAPKVSLDPIEKEAIANISKKPNLTALDRENLIADAQAEFDALRRKYGYSMSREDLNAVKKDYWGAKNWDATKPLKGDINHEIGGAFMRAIENNVDDVNVRELNRILGDHYDAAKFLRSVDAKAGKLTLTEKAKRSVVRAVSTAVGAQIGGVTGGATGFILADSINQAMSSMSNPLREYFLSRLRIMNPEAYQEYVKTLNYLARKEVERAARLKLEAGAPLGSDKNPIITPAPTTYEAPAQNVRRNE